MSNYFYFTYSGYVPTNNFEFAPPAISYKLLAGTSKNYVAVWADPTANIETARMYVATSGPGAAFSVVDLSNKVLLDSYTISDEGAYGESLDQENIQDIIVS